MRCTSNGTMFVSLVSCLAFDGVNCFFLSFRECLTWLVSLVDPCSQITTMWLTFGIAKVAIAGLVNGCGHDTMLDRNRHSHVDWSWTYSIAPWSSDALENFNCENLARNFMTIWHAKGIRTRKLNWWSNILSLSFLTPKGSSDLCWASSRSAVSPTCTTPRG